MVPAMPAPTRMPFAVLALAVIGISFAAPLVRLSGAHPLAIATWRLVFSLVIVGVALTITGGWRQWRTVSRRELFLACAGGVMLALHFWSWNTSVGMTSVAASVVLVNMQPVIVAIGSARLLAEPPSARQWTGVLVAIAGALIVASADFGAGALGASPRALLGDLLAFVGAVTAALYYLAGRRLRGHLDLWPYVGLVYGACFVTLLVLDAALSVPLWPQPPREFGIFIALAIGPMMLGHTAMNWALKHLPAYVVNLTTLGEPVGATVLAAALPWIAEVPSALTLLGGAVVLVGVVIAARRGETPTA